jgi:hypothetical protein
VGPTPTTADCGSLGLAPWTAETETLVYTIPKANLASAKGPLCQVYANLLIGINAAHYEASFTQSSLFLVLP